MDEKAKMQNVVVLVFFFGVLTNFVENQILEPAASQLSTSEDSTWYVNSIFRKNHDEKAQIQGRASQATTTNLSVCLPLPAVRPTKKK